MMSVLCENSMVGCASTPLGGFDNDRKHEAAVDALAVGASRGGRLALFYSPFQAGGWRERGRAWEAEESARALEKEGSEFS